MPLLDKMKWRYATKKMDPSKKIPQDKLDRILEAVRLAPTSSGLQPYEVIVVKNRDLLQKIQPIAFNQPQVGDCSELLVFAAWDDYTHERINKMFDLVNTERNFKSEGWENYRQMLLANYPPRGPEINFQHAARQAYIGMTAALVAAAFEEVDSTPMEGFDADALDELLGLRQQGLRSCVIVTLGYRQADQDWLVNLKKVRRAKDDFVKEIV
jgi:nitroreductase / dihydropteridine reductase